MTKAVLPRNGFEKEFALSQRYCSENICSRGNDINNYFFGLITTLTAKDLSIDVQWFVVNPNGLKGVMSAVSRWP